jgi:hypothetical protein
MVIACSDGRLQENLDEFLHEHLGIVRYDRFYVPGGGGALAASGFDLVRADAYHHECLFLAKAHDLHTIYLIFHAPAEDGPDEAICADYRRKFPWATAEEIRQQQEQDAREVIRSYRDLNVTIEAYRCEICGDGRVQMVGLGGEA